MKLLDRRARVEINEYVEYDSVSLEVKIELQVPFRFQGSNVRIFTLNEVAPKSEINYMRNNLEDFADCFILDMFNTQLKSILDIKKVKYIGNEALKNQLINDLKIILADNK